MPAPESHKPTGTSAFWLQVSEIFALEEKLHCMVSPTPSRAIARLAINMGIWTYCNSNSYVAIQPTNLKMIIVILSLIWELCIIIVLGVSSDHMLFYTTCILQDAAWQLLCWASNNNKFT